MSLQRLQQMSDVEALARIIEAEAGQESLVGKAAVGAVIDNRRKSGRYGKGWKGVIAKPGQFSAINDVTGYANGQGANKLFWRAPREETLRLAKAIVSGRYDDPTGGSTHYFNPRHADPKWAKGKKFTPIGNHVFGNADAGAIRAGGGQDVAIGDSGGDYFKRRYKEQGATESREQPQAGYFAQRYNSERKEPNIQTASPAMPEGMDDPAQPNWVQRRVNEAGELIAGNAEFDVPEVGGRAAVGEDGRPILMHMSEAARSDIGGRLLAADGEMAMANILKESVPGVEIEADSNGNLYVTFEGNRYALDKSGASEYDVAQMAKTLGLGFLLVNPAAKGGQAVAGNVGRFAGGGLGAGGEQLAEQVISNAAGGDQPLDWGRVVVGSIFGVGGEAAGKVVEFIGPKLWGAIFKAKNETNSAEEFRAALEGMGLDYDEVADILGKGLDLGDVDALGPDALARIADAKSLPVPVQLTTGQATRDPRLAAQETMARTTGAFGDDVQAQAAGASLIQQQSLQENAQALTSEISPLGDKASRSQAVQGALLKRRSEAKARVDQAYNMARSATGQAKINAAAIHTFADDMSKKIRSMAVPSQMEATREALSELQNLLVVNGGRVKALDIRALESWRSQVSNSLNGAQGGDKAGLAALLRSYDAAALKGFKSAVVSGDPSTIGLWRNAAKERASFGRIFENDSIVDRLTRTAKRRRGEVDIDEADVMSELLGMSTIAKKGTAREVRRLKEFLGADSEAWGALQAEGLVRLLGFDPAEPLSGPVSTKIVSNLRNALKNHPQLVNTLYTENQIRALRRFARTVESVNVNPRVAGDTNPSGSGRMAVEAASLGINKIAKAAEVLGRQFGAGGRVAASVVTKFVTGAANAAEAAAMRRSLQGLEPSPSPSRAFHGVGGVIGGEVGASVSQ